MAAPVGKTTRDALVWAGLGAVVLAAFIVTVAILNGTVYSASGFVRGYLDALDRGDTASALHLAGVTPKATDDLLTVSEKGSIGDISVVRETKAADDTRRVTMSYRLDGARRQAVFVVGHDGTVGGLFSNWRFAVAPTASLDVTPLHDERFTANGAAITAPGADIATRYTVLAPAVFDLSHDTTYLRAAKRTTVVASPGAVGAATITITPKQSFVDLVEADVRKYLRTTCLPQKVLQPAGCPFGQEVDDRVTSAPAWTMTTYPPVRLGATATPGAWLVARASGRANLEVEAQSLFDGHAYSIDQAVPFTVSYLVVIGSDDALTITPR